jgi:ubiquinol-cytochrome c reductase subunit 8
MATFINKGFWNVVRRSRNQVLYFIPPMIAGYAAMEWAIERWVDDAMWCSAMGQGKKSVTGTDVRRNEFLNSKQGRALYADEE